MVAVTALVVVSAIGIAVMCVPAFFGTSIYRADRADVIVGRLLSVMMAVGRNRHNEKERYHCCGHCCSKQFFQAHGKNLLSFYKRVCCFAGAKQYIQNLYC